MYDCSQVVPLPGLRRQRLLAALSQEDLANKAGIRRGTIIHIERGGDARPMTLRKLVQALGCTTRDLLDKPD